MIPPHIYLDECHHLKCKRYRQCSYRRCLEKLIQIYQVYILVILSLWIFQRSFDSIRCYLYIDFGVHNKSKKIWVFQNVGTMTTVIDDQIQFLHIRFEDLRLARSIYLALVYAACEALVRRDLWASLHRIFLSIDDLWLVGGDFNVIAHDGERTGHNR